VLLTEVGTVLLTEVGAVIGRDRALVPVGDDRLVLACFGTAPAEHPHNLAPPVHVPGAVFRRPAAEIVSPAFAGTA
jgi:hypothetical protein